MEERQGILSRIVLGLFYAALCILFIDIGHGAFEQHDYWKTMVFHDGTGLLVVGWLCMVMAFVAAVLAGFYFLESLGRMGRVSP